MSELNSTLIEKYIFAENKEEFLKTITPYTELYYLLEIMNHFQKQPIDHPKINTLVETFLKNQNFKSNFKEIVKFKLLLEKYQSAKSDNTKIEEIIEEINKNYFNLNFDHKSPFNTNIRSELRQENEKGLSSKLDPAIKEEQTLKNLLKNLYGLKSQTELNKISPDYYEHIDISKFCVVQNKALILSLLETHKSIHSIAGILEFCENFQKNFPNEVILETKVFPKLTLCQQEQLLKKKEFINIEELMSIFCSRKFKTEKEYLTKKPLEEKIKAFEDLLTFMKKLPEKYQDLTKYCHHKILRYQVKLGNISEALFLEYLKDPCYPEHPVFKENHRNKIVEAKNGKVKTTRRLEKVEKKDTKLFNEALTFIFKKAKDYNKYLDFFSDDYLKVIFHTVKAVEFGDTSGVKTALSESQLDGLFNQKTLEIESTNKKIFKNGDPVSLTLRIKNIQKLQVKIFEVNTLNFLLENNSQNYEKIELSGLIPSEEYLHTYSQPQILNHVEEFNFPSIQDKQYGVFVVDFIGGELSSRAMIYRGSLTLLPDRITGRKCTILSENGHVCMGENTGLYIQKKFFPANKTTGEISIPLNIKAISEKVIITHGSFADMSNLETKDPKFTFSSNLIFNSEQIMAGNTADFVLQTKLQVNQELVSLSLLSNVSAVITFHNEKGTDTKIEFKNICLKDCQDLLLQAIVPPKTVHVRITLIAERKYEEKTEILTTSQTIPIQRQIQNCFHQILFKKSTDGAIFLNVIGKNGEPRSGLVVNLILKYKHCVEVKKATLITDEHGVCELGVFENLDLISASCESACQTHVEIAEKFVSYESRITIHHRECIQIRISKDTKRIELFSKGKSYEYSEDLTAKHICKIPGKDAFMIDKLKKGNYILRIDNTLIDFDVVDGEYLRDNEQIICTPDSFVDVPITNKRKLIDVSKSDKGSIVHVHSNSMHSRAHLLTFNSIPGLIQKQIEENVKYSDISSETQHIVNPIKRRNNFFNSNRRLNDEVIYTNDRKTKLNFMGNTLEKPGILLKRNRIDETSETDQIIREGECQALDSAMGAMYDKKSEMMRKQATMANSYTISRNEIIRNDFLAKPGKLIANLSIHENKILIPLSDYKDYEFALVCIADETGCSMIPIHFSNNKFDLQDIRLKESKKPGHIYSDDKQTKIAWKGQELVIENIQNTETYIMKNMKDLFKVLSMIQGDSNKDLAEWSFLADWSNLSAMEKLKKYDKFSSHEFNIFLKIKDGEFFEGVVRPFLINKSEKTVIDFYLLDDFKGVEKMQDLASVSQLNKLEKVLLAGMFSTKNKNLSNSLCQFLKSKSALCRPSDQVKEKIYETILNDQKTSKLEENKPLRTTIGANNRNELDMMSFSGQMMGAGMMASPNVRFMDCRMDEQERSVNRQQSFGLNRSVLPSGEANIFTLNNGTIEYNEKKYFYGSFSADIQEFWADLAAHLSNSQSINRFLSPNFLFAAQTMSELIAVLTFMDFSFETHKIETSIDHGKLKIKSEANLLVLTNEIIEKETTSIEMDILCSQRMFDPNDRFLFDEEDSKLKIERNIDEFITGRVYGSRVVMTNSSASDLNLSLIYEIPQGSLPTISLDTLKITNYFIGSFQSTIVEFYFYFPQPGSFTLYPATVVKGEKIVATSRIMPLIKVGKTKQSKKLETISDIVAMGNTEDIIQFMRQKNILNTQLISFNQIYWLLKKKDFYEQVIAVCREKGVYDKTLWSYSFYHKDLQGVREFLKDQSNKSKFENFLMFCESELLSIDTFQIKEYYPLINPRAHVLGKEKTNIINNKFKQTYDQFLKYLFQKQFLTPKDKVLLINYLIAQDRIDEASTFCATIHQKELSDMETKIQHDYQRAYLDFITGYPKFEIVRKICEQYLTYPVLSWRNLFVEMVNQLAEFEEIDTRVSLDLKREGEALNKEKGKISASFSAELVDQKIKLVSRNLSKVDVKYFKLDPEMLFSLNPFDYDSGKSFKFVQPFFEDVVIFDNPSILNITQYEVHQKLQNESFFIEISHQSEELTQSTWINYAPFSLKFQHLQEFGIVKVFDAKTKKPVPRVYVKCFSKDKSGNIKFYKDGYTDLRGSFDYVSLNSDKLDNLSKFAILIISEHFGSKIVVTDPPLKIGRVEGEMKALISDNWKAKQANTNIASKQKYANLY